MPRRRTPALATTAVVPAALALKTAQLAWAVPQVMGHRLTRLALAGPQPSARDRREFHRMGAEKTGAFWASWWAMGLEAWRVQMALAGSLAAASLAPPAKAAEAVGRAVQQAHGSGLGVLGKGLGPVHATATANARRLARTRLR